MNKKRNLLITLSSLLCVGIILLSTLYFVYDYKPKGRNIIDEWHKEDTYTDKYVVTLNKEKDKDFTILNLADIQISDFEGIGENKLLKSLIKELIDRTNPDLITLTGDQIWTNHSKNALKKEIRWFKEFNIPWAPIFGNHDGEGTASIAYQCDLLEKAPNCLFKRGPTNIGSLGNYVINIKEDNKLIKSLYMLNLGSVDDFSKEQIDFVKYHAINNKVNDNYVEGITFMHQAIDAYNDAYYYHKDEAIGEVYRSFYISDEGVGDEYLEMAKSINMSDFICGHQHGNCFTIPMDNIRYTFALKTGDNCSIYENENNPNAFIVGGTSITLKDNDTIIKHNFVSDKYKTN